MFYPVDSLRRGGRFYLCWVADSWPLRFATVTHRQLWSQDIRKLCDDLLEVMTNESGRPSNRFSLRLSSQLMRGLVRLYERKVTVFLGDLCMLNANVFKCTNKKFFKRDETVPRPLAQLPQPPANQRPVPEEPETEQQLEELIQNSGNIVSNIQDITLKEAAIPEFQLPPNDGFGEQPDQTLQLLLGDRTIETMLVHPDSLVVQHSASGLDLPLDTTDKSHDKSRLPHDKPQMERIQEPDDTFLKSMVQEPMPGEFEKDIPEIPEIPLLDLNTTIPIPHAPQQIVEAEQPVTEEILMPKQPTVPVAPVPDSAAPASDNAAPVPIPRPSTPRQAPVDIELDELEDQPLNRKRRARSSRLIIDKRIKLNSEFLRARIDNPYVEMRCESSTEDLAVIRVPFHILRERPAASGARCHTRVADALTRMFQYNLVTHAVPHQPDIQEMEQPRQRRRTRSVLENIVEEPEQEIPQPQVTFSVEPPTDMTLRISHGDQFNITDPNITEKNLNITRQDPIIQDKESNITEKNPEITDKEPSVTELELNITNLMVERDVKVREDIDDLPTQKLETLSQIARKRASEVDKSPKRPRPVGYVSFRESQEMQLEKELANEPDKENIPPNQATLPRPNEGDQSATRQETDHQSQITIMLQEAGLAEATREIERSVAVEKQKRDGSESSETQLGSLDRTKVSVGDSVYTTESQRFIRGQWGLEGTMVKILNRIRSSSRVDIASLLRQGPTLTGQRHLIAARCFTSILKLKQHAFIDVEKDPVTLEIRNITLGPRFK